MPRGVVSSSSLHSPCPPPKSFIPNIYAKQREGGGVKNSPAVSALPSDGGPPDFPSLSQLRVVLAPAHSSFPPHRRVRTNRQALLRRRRNPFLLPSRAG